MTQPKPRTQVTDPTGITVANNVRRIREARGLSTYDLARRLQDGQRPIAANALAKLERAERRTDAGDLMALSVALGVSPTALLLPVDSAGRVPAEIEVTGAGQVPGWLAWGWADGACPLVHPDDDPDGSRWTDYALNARPKGWDASRNVGLKRGRAQLQRALDEHFKAFEQSGGDDGPSLD